MILFVLSYLGGALTILAPCILPVVPFVFARLDRPFASNGLPLLAGMAFTFAGVASLGAVAGHWAVEANEYGRVVALAALALMGASLVAPRIAQRLAQPLVALGNRLSNTAARHGAAPGGATVLPSFLLGVATGLLWAPCAGPVLGLILTAAAIQGPSVHTSLLLLAYAAGAATSLAVVLLVGGRLLTSMRRSFGFNEGLRKSAGVAVLAGVAAIGFGLDTGVLAQLSAGSGDSIEQRLIERLRPRPDPRLSSEAPTSGAAMMKVQAATTKPLDLPSQGNMPPLAGAVTWLNSPPLGAEQLRGKVVLVDFWTFGCINCRNALPYVREWHRKYKDQGLVVVGVHSPEFAFEKNIANVKKAASELQVEFPVAVDNDFAIWRAFDNRYWPAHYFVDAAGRIRFRHFGEGEYEKSEQVIRQLLEEARTQGKPT